MEIAISLLPILSIFALLFLFRQSAVRSGVIAYIITLCTTIFIPPFHLGFEELSHSTFRGVLTSSLVAYVLLFGILLFHLMNESHLIKAIANFIASSTPDPIQQVIILVVAFSPLVESVSGFGIAIIVVAPILVELGFNRFKATLLSLVGLSAVPWGALATGTVIGGSLGGIPVDTLGSGSALLAIPTFVYFALVAAYLAGGWRAIKSKGFELIVVSLSLGIAIWMCSKYVSVELAGVVGSLVAVGVELIFIRRSVHGSKHSSIPNHLMGASSESTYGIVKAMSPYFFLTGLLFLSRLIPPIEHFLTSHVILDLPSYNFRLPVLYSPGFCLFLACLFSILMFKIQRDILLKSIRLTFRQWFPVTMSTISFVAMSEIMSAAGMTFVLASAAVTTFGSFLMLFSPLIGGVGGFLTGSNTGSNAMFIKLQVQSANQLGLPRELFAYAQNTSASHMTMASPSRVLLGLTVCGIPNEQSRILRRISIIAAGSLLIIVFGLLRFMPF